MSADLGLVKVLGADAVGQPGQRRFRLFVQSARGSAFMWMEKEQLNSLSLALDRALALITEGDVLRTEAHVGKQPQPENLPEDFPSSPDYELQAGQIRLTFDEQDDTFVLYIIPLEVVIEEEQGASVAINEDDAISFAFTREEARKLSTDITAVVAAGRPVCPLCHMPLDGGPHACVKQNGHRTLSQIEDDEMDK